MSLIVFCSAGLAAAESCPASNLLSKASIYSKHVSHPNRLADGVAAREGDAWSSDLSAVLKTAQAHIVYDLGAEYPVSFVLLQADNNDEYSVLLSPDGVLWQEAWRAGHVQAGGMRTRSIEGALGRARFVKLKPLSGDGFFSAAEFQVLCSSGPAELQVKESTPLAELIWKQSLLWIGAFALFYLLAIKIPPRFALWLLLLPAAASLHYLWFLVSNTPLNPPLLERLRAQIAAAAIAVVLGNLLLSSAKLRSATLAMAAIPALLTFYNFGQPHFRNHLAGRGTWVHTFDMRVYFPNAKYFSELNYDGLYLASLAAYLENTPTHKRRSLETIRVRDLKDYRVTTADRLKMDLEGVKSRFSPERWNAFKADMAWFQEVMGDRDYLGTLTDHGANASPFWMQAAHALFSLAPASETFLTLTGLIDPLLLLILFAAIARTFGLQTALAGLIIFGTSDFQKFGANLAGSTLRYDWLMFLGTGICAIKTRRFGLGGCLLAVAALIRVFPAFALAALLMAAGHKAAQILRNCPRPLLGARLKQGLRPFFMIFSGAFLTVLILGSLPLISFSFAHSWGQWLPKILRHADKPSVNVISLRSVAAYKESLRAEKVIDHSNPEPWTLWQETQKQTLRERRHWLWFAALSFLLASTALARAKPPYFASLCGLVLIPVFLYPANYYLHYVCLLALLAAPFYSRHDGRISAAPTCSAAILALLFALSIGQFYTLKKPWADVCFAQQSLLTLTVFAAVLGLLSLRDKLRTALLRGRLRLSPKTRPKRVYLQIFLALLSAACLIEALV